MAVGGRGTHCRMLAVNQRGTRSNVRLHGDANRRRRDAADECSDHPLDLGRILIEHETKTHLRHGETRDDGLRSHAGMPAVIPVTASEGRSVSRS